MKVEEVKKHLKPGYAECKAWRLTEKIIEQMNKIGFEPDGIFYLYDNIDDRPLGDKLIGVRPIHRSNATDEDVTAVIDISEIVKNGFIRIATIKVPKDASERVIIDRINKALAYK